MSARREAALWLRVAETLDETGLSCVYGTAYMSASDRGLADAAHDRLRSYDDPAWAYDAADGYANLSPEDAVLVALWLWRECAASAAQHGTRE